jgi:acyl carrier protein
MWPGRWIGVEGLPQTASGKVDYRKLEAMKESEGPGEGDPYTPIEEELLGVWRAVLGLAEIGRDDNFFQLGGHSLSAMRLAAVIETAFNTRIQLQDIFKYPTIRSQGELLQTLEWLWDAPQTPVGETTETVWII